MYWIRWAEISQNASILCNNCSWTQDVKYLWSVRCILAIHGAIQKFDLCLFSAVYCRNSEIRYSVGLYRLSECFRLPFIQHNLVNSPVLLFNLQCLETIFICENRITGIICDLTEAEGFTLPHFSFIRSCLYLSFYLEFQMHSFTQTNSRRWGKCSLSQSLSFYLCIILSLILASTCLYRLQCNPFSNWSTLLHIPLSVTDRHFLWLVYLRIDHIPFYGSTTLLSQYLISFSLYMHH